MKHHQTSGELTTAHRSLSTLKRTHDLTDESNNFTDGFSIGLLVQRCKGKEEEQLCETSRSTSCFCVHEGHQEDPTSAPDLHPGNSL